MLAVLQELVNRIVTEEDLAVKNRRPRPDIFLAVNFKELLPFGDSHRDRSICVADFEMAGHGGGQKRIDMWCDASYYYVIEYFCV